MNMEEAAARELRAMRDAWRSLRRDWDLDRRETLAILQGDDEERVLTAAIETRMRLLLAIGYRLDVRAGEDILRERLRRPNPVFGWLSPLEAMSGRIEELRAVRTVVEAAAWS